MDLFFKNTPYFVSTYLDFALWKYALTAAVIYFVLHIFLRYVVKMSMKKTVVIAVIFSLYFALIIGMTLLGDNRSGKTGLILDPIYGLKKVVLENNIHFLRGMLSNILFFIPAGVFYVIINYKYHFLKGVLVATLVSCLLETLQYILNVGYFETSDMLCNVIGMIVGMEITLLVLFIKDKMKTKKQVEE